MVYENGICPMIGGYGTGYGVFGWITNILIVIALVLLIVWLVRKVNEKPTRNRK
jgi:flagellar biogenesis protein FliO